MFLYRISIIFILLFSTSIYSQRSSSTKDQVEIGLNVKSEKAQSSLVKNVPFKNIGPTIMSGRVTDLAVNPKKPSEFYVAYASGGLWHTVNNGTTFNPILDSSNTQNVGDIAVDWQSGTIWVGTGENNASRSSYAGIGLLKSTDNGKTWENVGLTDTHHIGRILINPNNPDEVIVGSTGHLYSPNEERGIFKTTDGGKSWKKTLFVDDMSGIIDLQHSPANFSLMFASSWTKDRKAWNFDGSGNNSAIYKSEDAGETWTKVSTENSGFPIGMGVGRIGLAVYNDTTIYAIHDSQFRRETEKEKVHSESLAKDDFKNMDSQTFLNLDDKKLDAFLETNAFQEQYRSANVKNMVRSGSATPIDLAKYLEDANSLLFDTPVVGAEIYRSDDGGESWNKVNTEDLEGLYYSYGYYFGHIYVSPINADHIYIYGVPILKSKDGGKTFSSINASNVHADHHALWINPNDPNHLINGNDGGVNITYDDGENWIKNNSPAVGQFYFINVDNEKPYNIYGGLQDNGVWVGPHTAQENTRWHQSGSYPWESIMGGDGMQIQIDNRNSNIVYTGFQFGNYFRINRATNETTYIQPKHLLGESPYRFNWQTPILLSPHNQDILYLGGNKLMRSMNQGTDWKAISEDLTTGGKKGNVPYGTISAISESPLQFGLIYVGTDDGNIQLTKDGGATWRNVTTSLPKDLWVSRVVASEHKKERVYATLNGYRWDDFSVYVYKSDDYGVTWKSIGQGIPMSPVNVIIEDPKSEKLLFVGTDNGAYVSFDEGNNWDAFSNGLPSVAVHDLKIQERDNDLLVGTHGRSIYKADLEPIQKMGASKFKEAFVLSNIEDIKYSSRWGSSRGAWSEPFVPMLTIPFYASKSDENIIQIKSKTGLQLASVKTTTEKGLNYAEYDLSISEKMMKSLKKENSTIEISKSDNGKYYLPKGLYSVELNGVKTDFEIK